MTAVSGVFTSFLNGSSQNGIPFSTDFTGSRGPLYLGISKTLSTSDALQAELHELILFNASLSDLERIHVERYLCVKWLNCVSNNSISVRGANVTVLEVEQVVNITIDRLGLPDGEMEIILSTMSGSAIVSIDFEPLQTVLYWSHADNSSRNVSLRILDDNLFQPMQKQFFITFSVSKSSFPVRLPSPFPVYVVDFRIVS